MTNCGVILHFGNDPLLAEARVLVLEDAGYDVFAAETQAAALRLLRNERIEVVIACHTVPPDELESTVQQIRMLKPHVPVIVVHVGGLVPPQRALADGFIDGLRGPEHLLSQVAGTITRNTTAAAS